MAFDHHETISAYVLEIGQPLPPPPPKKKKKERKTLSDTQVQYPQSTRKIKTKNLQEEVLGEKGKRSDQKLEGKMKTILIHDSTPLI